MDARTQTRYRDETRWLVVRRGPLCAILLTVSVVVAGALEYAYQPERLPYLVAASVAELGIWAALLWAYRVRALRSLTLELTQAACIALILCVTGYFSLTRANPAGLAFVFIVFELTTALVFPWGWRKQAPMVAVSVLFYGGFLAAAGTDRYPALPVSYELAAIAVAGAFCVVGAAVLDRQRRTVFAQREQLDRHMTTFRDLTQTLLGFDPQRVLLLTCIATLQAFSLRRLWAVWQVPGSDAVQGYLARRDGEVITMEVVSEPLPLWKALALRSSSGQAFLAHDAAPHVVAALGVGDVRSLLTVPIRFEDENLGAMCADRGGEPFDLDERELALASVLAGGAAIAIANARLYQRAAAASEEKSSFLARIAHELRNPVHTALWDIDTLRRQAGEPQPILERLRQNTLMTLEAANELQEFSEVETKRLTVRPAAVDLGRLFEDVRATAEALLAARPITFRTQIGPDVGTVVTDPFRLRQILGNLVSNAVKFTKRGTIVLDARRAGPDVVISVRDSGIGISEGEIAAVFAPFWRGAAAEMGPTRGMGLGLAIAQELATRLGGRIEVESRLGVGSTFSVLLAAAPPGCDDAVVAGSAPPSHPVEVLFIDDDARYRAQMAQALRRDGARVVEAADGSEGLRRARRHAPDVIVLDLSLPGRDGFDVLLHLKRHRRLASVPVVVATGDTDGQLERKCRNAGGAAYLVKPHAPEDLSQVVMALAGLRERRLEREA
jgi:signal transduction histidine kinase/ActR/RegA family two-component response regulator